MQSISAVLHFQKGNSLCSRHAKDAESKVQMDIDTLSGICSHLKALVLLNLSTSLCYCVFICIMLHDYIFTYVLCCNYILIYMLFSDPEVHCCLMVIRWTSFDFDAKFT